MPIIKNQFLFLVKKEEKIYKKKINQKVISTLTKILIKESLTYSMKENNE